MEIQAAIKAAPYCYRSYNPASIKLYAERYAWWVESLEYVVLNKRTAVTRPLARRIMRGCTKGSNPTDLAEELLELKAETFNSLEAQVYGMHLFAKERQAGRQHTLDGWRLGAFVEFSRAGIGFCSPGHKLIRHFFMAVHNADAEYKLSWRQQNVPVNIAAVDATMKRGSALTDLKIRQTLWSNDANAPLIAIMVNSASMDDPAFKAAAIDYNNVVTILGMGAMKLLYLDCPFRDGPGAMRRFPSLQFGAVCPISFIEDGNLSLLTTAAEVDAWLLQFDTYQETELEFGLDIEWCAYMQGIFADTLQLVHLGRGDSKPLGAFIPLTKVGLITARLAALLQRSILGGVKVDGDLKRLSEVYPMAGLHHHDDDAMPSTIPSDHIVDLAALAANVLRLAPGSVRSLANVLAHCCPGRSLNKQLVDVKKVRWEEWPLKDAEAINYGMNDAYASALALRRLRHPARFTQPPPQPPLPPAAAPVPPPPPPLPAYFAMPTDEGDSDDDSDFAVSETASETDEEEIIELSSEEEDEEQSMWALRRLRRELLAAGCEINGGAEMISAFACLDPQLQADLIGACDAGGAAPMMSEEDELEADEAEHGAAVAGATSEVRAAVRKTVLEAAADLIMEWAASGDQQPLELPSCLTDDDRSSLHAFCQARMLKHDTFGEPGQRQLRVSRKPAAPSAATATAPDGANPPPTSATSFAIDILSSLEFVSTWTEVLIKYDPRHWMGNWFLMAQSKSSSLFKFFCTATSDAMFEEREGERERVKQHLRKLFKRMDLVDPMRWRTLSSAEQKAEIERVDGLIARVHRSYWRSHCRYTIPPPEQLARRLLTVYYFFRKMDDPETGKPFFTAGNEKICCHELSYVAKGEVSDHPTIEVYAPDRLLFTGLQIFFCLRTSSALEGYHQHFHDAVSKAAKAAGLQFTEAATNEFDFRWTVRALRRRGLLPSWLRHYNTSLVDSLYDTLVKLGGLELANRQLPGWRRSRIIKEPLVKHGFFYGQEAQKLARPLSHTQPPPPPPEAPLSEGAWVAQRLGSPQPLRTRRSRADVEALLNAPASSSAEALSRLALERQLHLSGKAASSFEADIEREEAARLALEEAGYKALQQELRTRAADRRPDATLAALGPPLRRGSGALPGPLPGMAAQLQRPAMLAALEEDEGDEGEGEEEEVGEQEQEKVRGTKDHHKPPAGAGGVTRFDHHWRGGFHWCVWFNG